MFGSKNRRDIILGIGFAVLWAVFGFVVKIGLRHAPAHAGPPAMYAIQELTTYHVKRTTLKKIYTAEIGVREATGHNDGARVQEYLRYVNLKGNFSYCAAFVCWSLGQAGMDNPGNGWAPALFPQKWVIWTRGRGAVQGLTTYNLARTTPTTGDVFGIYFSELKRIAHCGFVDQWDDTWCITVEANTSNPIRAGPANEGVYRKRRLLKTIYKVSNWVDQR